MTLQTKLDIQAAHRLYQTVKKNEHAKIPFEEIITKDGRDRLVFPIIFSKDYPPVYFRIETDSKNGGQPIPSLVKQFLQRWLNYQTWLDRLSTAMFNDRDTLSINISRRSESNERYYQACLVIRQSQALKTDIMEYLNNIESALSTDLETAVIVVLQQLEAQFNEYLRRPVETPVDQDIEFSEAMDALFSSSTFTEADIPKMIGYLAQKLETLQV